VTGKLTQLMLHNRANTRRGLPMHGGYLSSLHMPGGSTQRVLHNRANARRGLPMHCGALSIITHARWIYSTRAAQPCQHTAWSANALCIIT
jgi:hypothetical protein